MTKGQTIFHLNFLGNDDFINWFWNCLTFSLFLRLRGRSKTTLTRRLLRLDFLSCWLGGQKTTKKVKHSLWSTLKQAQSSLDDVLCCFQVIHINLPERYRDVIKYILGRSNIRSIIFDFICFFCANLLDKGLFSLVLKGKWLWSPQ